jgi:hypothetical protein
VRDSGFGDYFSVQSLCHRNIFRASPKSALPAPRLIHLPKNCDKCTRLRDCEVDVAVADETDIEDVSVLDDACE